MSEPGELGKQTLHGAHGRNVSACSKPGWAGLGATRASGGVPDNGRFKVPSNSTYSHDPVIISSSNTTWWSEHKGFNITDLSKSVFPTGYINSSILWDPLIEPLETSQHRSAGDSVGKSAPSSELFPQGTHFLLLVFCLLLVLGALHTQPEPTPPPGVRIDATVVEWELWEVGVPQLSPLGPGLFK